MRNVQKTETREERKVVRDFTMDPMEGFPSDSLFPSRSNEINNFFRTPSPSAGFPSHIDNSFDFNSSSHQNHIDEHHHSTVTTFNGTTNNSNGTHQIPSSSNNFSNSLGHNSSNNFDHNWGNSLSHNFSPLSHNLSQSPSHQGEPGKYVEIIPLGGNIGPEDLTVTLKDHVMTIEAKKETKNDYGTGVSRSYQEFTKKFTLPPGIDMRQVKSMLTPDGNLKIEAPLPQKALPAPPQRRERDIAIRIQ